MRKKIILLLICAMLLSTLTACYDMHEITDLAFVHFIGIDRGVTDKWRLTLKIASMRQEKGGSSTEGGKDSGAKQKTGTETVTIDAPSFYGGISLLNTNIPQWS